MNVSNYIKLEFPSKSVNEGYARSAVGAVAPPRDPPPGQMWENPPPGGVGGSHTKVDKLRVRSAPGKGTTVTMARRIRVRNAGR